MTGIVKENVDFLKRGVRSVLGIKKTPPPPQTAPPLLPDETALKREKRRKAAQRATQGSGRVSTILSSNASTGYGLGG